MVLERLILKREDYEAVGNSLTDEDLREIVRVSGVSLKFLVLLSAISAVLAYPDDLLAIATLIAYAAIYAYFRNKAPHRTVSLAYLLPRVLIKGYQIVAGTGILNIIIAYLGVLIVEIVNEKTH